MFPWRHGAAFSLPEPGCPLITGGEAMEHSVLLVADLNSHSTCRCCAQPCPGLAHHAPQFQLWLPSLPSDPCTHIPLNTSPQLNHQGKATALALRTLQWHQPGCQQQLTSDSKSRKSKRIQLLSTTKQKPSAHTIWWYPGKGLKKKINYKIILQSVMTLRASQLAVQSSGGMAGGWMILWFLPTQVTCDQQVFREVKLIFK